jgi:antirestriction protein ArdC
MAMDIYADVTAKIVAMLEAGVVPWRSPILGQQKAGWPKNLESGKEYRGVNVFLLAFTGWAKGYESAHWLTFNQAKARGGSVKEGEKSSMVVFWKQFATTDKETGEAVTVPVLRYYNVFNVEQCDGVPVPDAPVVETRPFSPIETAEQIVSGYAGRPEIEHRGSRAYYTPKTDAVIIPQPERFASTEEYYGTLFHELAHSTGHSTRLDRGIDTTLAPFGSPDYGREELVAEMAASFLCGHAGIVPATVENSAAYIGGWIKTLKGDKRLAISAAGAAQRAADWIRGIRGDGNATAETNPAPTPSSHPDQPGAEATPGLAIAA